MINNGYLGCIAREKTSEMGHVSQDADLSCVTALAAKVWASDNIQAIVYVNVGVIRYEFIVNDDFLQRMAAVSDSNAVFSRRNHYWSNVLLVHGTRCKGQNAIQVCQGVEGTAHLAFVVQNNVL